MKKRAVVAYVQVGIVLVVLAGAIDFLQGRAAAADSPKALFPGIVPVCPCESLTNVALPNTRIESAVVDATNNACRVTAIVSHPSANKDRVHVWIALPLTNWNGRFRGNGGGGYMGGSPGSLPGSVRQGFASGATDTGHEGGAGNSRWTRRGG